MQSHFSVRMGLNTHMRSKLICGNSFSSRYSSLFFVKCVWTVYLISHGVVLLSGLPYRNSIASIPLFSWCQSWFVIISWGLVDFSFTIIVSRIQNVFNESWRIWPLHLLCLNYEELNSKDLPACVRSAFGHFYSDTQYKPVLLWETASHRAPLQTVRRAICVILTCVIGWTWCKMAYCVHQSLFTDETRAVHVGFSTHYLTKLEELQSYAIDTGWSFKRQDVHYVFLFCFLFLFSHCTLVAVSSLLQWDG